MGFEGLKKFFEREKTFRPVKKLDRSSHLYELQEHAYASLSAGVDLKEAVKKPKDESLNDWFAVHVVDFYNRLNLVFGVVSDYCTPETCPKMSGGKKFEYYWQGKNEKKASPCPANEYIFLLMDWVEDQINDKSVFPTESDNPFPRNFQSIVKKILSRLYRIFVHVYIHHFDKLELNGAEAHVNTCYKHFYYFVMHFDMIEKKELEPLRAISEQLCQ